MIDVKGDSRIAINGQTTADKTRDLIKTLKFLVQIHY